MIAYTETTSCITVNNGYAWPTKSGYHGYRLTRYGIVIYECTPFNNELCTIIQFVYGNRLIERAWPIELSQNQITRRVNKLVADVTPKKPTSTMNDAVAGMVSAVSSFKSAVRKDSK